MATVDPITQPNPVFTTTGALPTRPQPVRLGGSLFGLHVDGEPLLSSTRMIEQWAVGGRARLVVTPNTDHFLRWQKDAAFREHYTTADLTVLDGAPLTLLARLEGLRVHRVTGVEIFYAAAESAARTGVPFVIIGGREGVAAAAAERLREQLPALRTPVLLSPRAHELESEEWLRSTAEALRAHPRKYVALCLGSPKQERLFGDLLAVAPDLAGAFLCVGASADFAAGTLPRAPRFMRRIGMEWLFRLIVEPRRLWRRYLVDDVQLLGYLARSIARRARRTGTSDEPRSAGSTSASSGRPDVA